MSRIGSVPDAIDAQELGSRRDRIRLELERSGIDVLVIFGTECEPGGLRYTVGYSPTFEPCVLVLNRNGSEVIICGPESAARVRRHVRISDQRHAVEFSNSADPDIVSRDGRLVDVLEPLLRGIVGLVGGKYATASLMDVLRGATGVTRIVPADRLLTGLRMVKSASEMALLEFAYAVAEEACRVAVSFVSPGVTEREVENVTIRALMANGAHGLGYTIWCAAGENTACPITKSTDRPIARGEIVQITASAEVDGYCSGVGVPLLIGRCPDNMVSLRDSALRLRDAAMAIMRAGVSADDAARSMQERVAELGISDAVVHGPAHSVGCMECEAPFVQRGVTTELAAGMVLNADIWLQRENFGLRCEDGLLLEQGRQRWLSAASLLERGEK